jgi:hypothetical protein
MMVMGRKAREANGGGKAERTRCASSKAPRQRKKMLFGTSEASMLLKTQDRDFQNAENELIFERK